MSKRKRRRRSRKTSEDRLNDAEFQMAREALKMTREAIKLARKRTTRYIA